VLCCICSVKEDDSIAFACLVKIGFVHKTSRASHQIYEDLRHKLFSVVAYIDKLKVNVVVVVVGVIIADVKEVVIALVSQFDMKEIVLFKLQEESQKRAVQYRLARLQQYYTGSNKVHSW
jgi:hypothetical protein